MTDNNNIEIFEFSKYVQPSILPLISKKWVLNGDNNSFYKYISQCYDGSVTNQAIINGYVSYIYGEGLYDVNGINLSKYISKGDTRLITQDYYTYGAYALQVIWNMAKTAPIQVKYIPVFKLGLNIDHNTMMTTGYWYSFDWEQQTKYKPMFFHKFDGTYKDEDVEIIMVQRPTSKPFFANPSYVSCLEYAELEMELAHSSISHVKNGFQGGTLVNMNNGVPESNELKELYKRKIIDNLTASGNRNKVIVSFNESAEKAITVENLSVPELNQQYVNFDETAERKIIIGHSAPPILFSGSRDGGGLGNNSEELKTSTQSLYRKHINPMREVIIDGLMDVFRFINPELDLKFKDFEEFDEVKVEVAMAGEIDRVSFDFDGVLTTAAGIDKLKEKLAMNGVEVYIISARNHRDVLIAFADRFNIPHSRVFAVGSNTEKVQKIKDLNITHHYDDNQSVLDELGSVGRKINN